MIQGTGSGVGKSLLAAGLLRILSGMGVKAAPFKAQNMALNSFITEDGGEIGRAQAMQAEAARVVPTTDMNPVLLKATGEAGSQVIIHGKVHGNMTAKQYYGIRQTAWEAVKQSWERLRGGYDVIILEGAGSPAEINLMDKDIVNMKMARHAGAGVLLVGDIERGGVFASLYGTINLLDGYRESIKGFIINKFRGDMDILAPGLKMLEERTGVRPLGVLPYFNCALSEEDSLCLGQVKNPAPSRRGALRIVVVRLGLISNFTDFEPFLHEPDVELVYSLKPSDIEGADMIIIPGSKNTIKDLLFLRETGLEESIKKAALSGIPLAGICGGYQMLGKAVRDPHGVEGTIKETPGFGLLDVETVLEKTKTTTQVEAWEQPDLPDGKDRQKMRGYEIHMGTTTGDTGLFKLKRSTTGETVRDGSRKNKTWGTYIHGIFDNDGFRGELLNGLRRERGLPEIPPVDYALLKEQAMDRLAGILEANLDMKYIKALLCLPG